MYRPVAAPLFSALALLLTAFTSRAEITVTVDHNGGREATEDFQFKTVPRPRQDAAIGATFTLVDGVQDPNGASPDVLHDGKVPDSDDEPDTNFFFQSGSDGGRLLVDLGKVIPIKEVDTYSWHSDTRAPQVYKLYGSEGGPGFNAKPRRPQDPVQAGWKLLASVDTRQKFGNAGGQYGVSASDPREGVIGSYRYLLLDIARTEGDDAFGNTFYSEIDVIDRNAPPDLAPATHAKETSTYDEKGLHLTFSNDSPTFDPKEKIRLWRPSSRFTRL